MYYGAFVFFNRRNIMEKVKSEIENRMKKTIKALNDNLITTKGKGGLVRKVPLQNEPLVRELYKKTPPAEEATEK